MAKSICSVEDCGNHVSRGGLCGKHHYRFATHGDPLKVTRIVGGDPMVRFMSKVAKMPNGCHEWQGAKLGKYGSFTIDGGAKVATRWLWQHLHGPISDDLQVRHKCDNPPCVNIDHLEIGTRRDNSRDMVERGRSLRGERSWTAKLGASEVIEIREMFASGKYSKGELARAYGTTPQNIRHIVNYFSWKHVA